MLKLVLEDGPEVMFVQAYKPLVLDPGMVLGGLANQLVLWWVGLGSCAGGISDVLGGELT